MSELRRIDFGLIQPKLAELLYAAGNWIERSWPGQRTGPNASADGSRLIFLLLIRSTENTWRTAAFLTADVPKNYSRKPEYVLSVSPLTRTVLEALCTTIFIFGNIRPRTEWYYKSGWREIAEELERMKGRYGDDPDWSKHLGEQEQLVALARDDWGITPAESADLKRIKRFPLPDKMPQQQGLSQDRQDQLAYLLAWYYRTQSQDAHLSWPGLARRGAIFIADLEPTQRTKTLALQRAEIVGTLATLCLALVSEIEIECRFGMTKQLRYAWVVLNDAYDDAKALYERFYRDTLP